MRWLAVLVLFLLASPSWAEPLQRGTAVTALADVTVTSAVTLVAAANSARASLSCTNTSSSVNVRWGDSAITATKGQQLRAGLSVEIRNSDGVYMISEGANVTVSCTEETR